MAPTTATPSNLTPEAFLEAVVDTLGTRLVAAYRFGADFGRGRGAVARILILIDRIDRFVLDEIIPHVTHAERSRIHVRIDSPDNLLRGADAFPAFALELMDHRKLLAGDDVLEKLTVERHHLRLHVEHGLRGIRRDVLRSYLRRDRDGDDVVELRRMARKLFFLFEGALIAAGKDVRHPPEPGVLVDQICHELLDRKADTTSWHVLKRFGKASQGLSGNELMELYTALFETLDEVVSAVDRLDEVSRS